LRLLLYCVHFLVRDGARRVGERRPDVFLRQRRIGVEERLVGPGDAVLIRSGTEYALRVLEDLEVVVFSEVSGTGPRAEVATRPLPWRTIRTCASGCLR